MSDKIIIFFDALGRTILGTSIAETATTIEVQNPAILHAGLNEEQKIRVNLIPAFFREFLVDWNSPLVFAYQKANIVIEQNGNTLDPKLIQQYTQMWGARPPRDQVQKIVRELTPSIPDEKPVERLNLFQEITPGDTTAAPVSA